jgi:amphi-Trp domain-containing protein
MEEVVFETEGEHPRDEIAEYLEQVAENLRHGDVTIVSGDDEVSVEPPEEAVFEVKVGRDGKEDEESVTVGFEIGWTRD